MAKATDQKALTRYKAAVTRVRALLNRWIESGLELFLELRKIELEGSWTALGHAGFQDFLSTEFPNTLGIERYNNVITAISIHGEDFVRKVGVHSCHALSVQGVAENPQKAELVRASVVTHIQNYGSPPETAEIRKIVRGIVGEPARLAKSTRQVTALALAQEEIKRLRKRIAELERECERLQKKNAKSRSTGGGSRKASAKDAESQRS